MRSWDLSVNAAFYGAARDRFTVYQADRNVAERITLAAQTAHTAGIELRYPKDFQDVALVKRGLEETGLKLSAVNVDLKDAAFFRFGALSARSPEARLEAIRRLKVSMDIAADFNCGVVTSCPLADGYDYPFEQDHASAWGHLIESSHEAAAHRDDVNLVLEYQPHEPHARPLLANVGMMLHLCNKVGLDNFGANLDIGHAFAGQENPAEAASLLNMEGRLMYMHSNDNPGDGGDWDMVSGGIHFWHWLELLYTLDKIGYDGWIGADLSVNYVDAVEVFSANARMIRRMERLVAGLDPQVVEGLLATEGHIGNKLDVLADALFGAEG